MQAGLTPGPHWRAWGTGPDMQDQPLLDSPPWLHEGTVKFFLKNVMNSVLSRTVRHVVEKSEWLEAHTVGGWYGHRAKAFFSRITCIRNSSAIQISDLLCQSLDWLQLALDNFIKLSHEPCRTYICVPFYMRKKTALYLWEALAFICNQK